MRFHPFFLHLVLLIFSFIFFSPQIEAAHFKKVFIVILENEDQVDAIEQPFMKSLKQKGISLEDFHAVERPSQPNYIALIAGSTFGVKSNANVDLDEKHLGDLLEAKNLSWKNYAEDYPGSCFLGAEAVPYEVNGKPRFKYTRKHIPFLSFKNISGDPKRCARIVDAKELDKDLAQKTIPHFSIYTPNNENNGHDTGVAFADRWLAQKFGPLLKDERFTKDLLFIVTFDEGSKAQKIATLLVGPGIQNTKEIKKHLTHYDLLRTVEKIFNLPSLGRKDSKAEGIAGF